MASEADAAARRIEQLGSDKAPVRLGGLYALEHLAQDHTEQRQTIINVLCAYLRMPYSLPGEPPADSADEALATAFRHRAQEREVRLTAQRVITHHLRPGEDPEHPVESFWAGIDLDLTGAALIDLDLRACIVRHARFNQATFTGVTWCDRATFIGVAWFTRATFHRHGPL